MHGNAAPEPRNLDKAIGGERQIMDGLLILKRACAIATVAALFAASAFAQGIDYSRIKRSTLEAISADVAASVAADQRQAPPKIGDKIYDRALSSWVVEVSYDGAIRPMNADETIVVHNSFKAVSQETLAAAYEQSMLFRVKGKDYWLPVASAMIPYFAKELRPGEKIDLYVLLSGGLLQESGWEWLFVVVDFQKPQDNAAREKP